MVLIKYKNMSVLVDESADIEPFIANIEAIYDLDVAVKAFYKNLLNAKGEDAIKIGQMRQKLNPLRDKMKIIGAPFDTHDAQLYAVDHNIEYSILEIHGNSGNRNAKKEKKADSFIQMRVLTRRKSAYKKQASKEGKKLTAWILEQCEKGLSDELSS
jgi:hypothetical protein